ncbi:MAG: helix-turn-helix domain-containing protein, partial [Rubrivivax sp.]
AGLPLSVLPLADQVAALERRLIAGALVAARGNRAAAARQLGMPRSVLYERLARWPDLISTADPPALAPA